MSGNSTVPADVLALLGRQDPTDLSDASTGVVELSGLELLWTGSQPARMVGRALTVDTRFGDNAAVREALDLVAEGDVLVISGKGFPYRAVIGDQLGRVAVDAGAGGFVIDGAIRDPSGLASLGVPLFYRHVTITRATKLGLGRVGGPVAICGEVVEPGDVLVGTDNGLCVVPAAYAEQVTAEFGDDGNDT